MEVSSSNSQEEVGGLCSHLPPYAYSPPIECCVFGWGVAEDGQLASSSSDNVLSPKVVEALLGKRFRGRGFGRSPIVAGSRNTMIVTSDGEVFSWGWNARATLGQGHRNIERKPRRVALPGVFVQQVTLGGWHSLAVDSDGQTWSWGGNEYQQCGLQGPPSTSRDVLTPTPCLVGLRIKQVAAGGMHSLALTESGEIWMWGEPWGDFSMTIDRRPRRIDTTGDFVRIVCGAFHNLALNDKGECFTWGINNFGQLGSGTTNYATVPEKVVDLEGVFISDIAAGGWHSVAIAGDGSVYVWGRGEYGRLGLGDKSGSSRLRPQKLKGLLEGHKVVEATCGGTHTIVVTEEGRCFIWGRGSFGRLGTGSGQKDCLSPVEVKLPGGPERWRVISAAAGGRHSMVLALPDNGNDSSSSNYYKYNNNNSSMVSGGRNNNNNNNMPWLTPPASVHSMRSEGATAATGVTEQQQQQQQHQEEEEPRHSVENFGDNSTVTGADDEDSTEDEYNSEEEEVGGGEEVGEREEGEEGGEGDNAVVLGGGGGGEEHHEHHDDEDDDEEEEDPLTPNHVRVEMKRSRSSTPAFGPSAMWTEAAGDVNEEDEDDAEMGKGDDRRRRAMVSSQMTALGLR